MTDLQTSSWRSRAIFITSTFQDMHAERDYLRTHVFPAIEEQLRDARCTIEPVDLRWGVETVSVEGNEAKQLQVLKVCLAEVKRSRPFLIALIGDRYGWIPPVDRMQQAALEAGFDGEVAGRSVTNLEIDYGIFAQKNGTRALVYLRDPLPYAEMPAEIAARYSDSYASENSSASSSAKLHSLKQALKSRLPGRVRSYHAEWDHDKACVTGLEEFGQTVLRDLRAALEADLGSTIVAHDPQTIERMLLDQFIEHRCRGFVGREGVVQRLVELTVQSDASSSDWGCYVTGEAGAGKSALFAMLHTIIEKNDVVVLSHAVGISPRGAHIENVIAQWTLSLANVLNLDYEPSTANFEGRLQDFRTLLARTCENTRVIIVVDALDQFQVSPYLRSLAWLPHAKPANLRVVVTLKDSPQTYGLRGVDGLHELRLPTLTFDDSEKICQAICRRYHRTIHPEIITALLNKSRPDGTRAAANALWLSSAVEELNLLDADDFARAEQQFTGDAEARLHQLLLSTVEQIPGEIDALYDWMLSRAERLFGKNLTEAFVRLIATGREGWRELDLAALIPNLSNEPWDPLQFAALRRSFRAHLAPRGTHGRWHFVHSQMLRAVEARYAFGAGELASLHAVIAAHLQSLPPDDPLRQNETTFHWISADDPISTARYCATSMSDDAAEAAMRAIGEFLLANDVHLQWVSSLLEQPELDDDVSRQLCAMFANELQIVLREIGSTRLRHEIAAMTIRKLDDLALRSGEDLELKRDLVIALHARGSACVEQEDLSGALACFVRSAATATELANKMPDYELFLELVVEAQKKCGFVFQSLGDIGAALKALDACLQNCHRFLERTGHIEWHARIASTFDNIGKIHLDAGRIAEATTCFQSSMEHLQTLAKEEPADPLWQSNIASAHLAIGDSQFSKDNADGALKSYQAALGLLSVLLKSNPESTSRQYQLAQALSATGKALHFLGLFHESLQAHKAALALYRRLVNVDRSRLAWLSALARTWQRIGHDHQALGNVVGARQALKAGLSILHDMLKTNLSNAELLDAAAVGSYNLGDIARHDGNEQEATEFFSMCYRHLCSMRAAGHILRPSAAQIFEDLDGGRRQQTIGGGINGSLADLDKANELYKQNLHDAAQSVCEEMLGVTDKPIVDAERLALIENRELLRQLLFLRGQCLLQTLKSERLSPTQRAQAWHQSTLVRALLGNDSLMFAITAQTLIMIGELREAREMVDHAVRLDPTSAIANEIAERLSSEGPRKDWRNQTEGAIYLIHQTMEHADQGVDSGKLQQASNLLAASLNVNDQQVRGWAALAWLHLILNDEQNAVAAFRNAQSLDPSGSDDITAMLRSEINKRGLA